MNDFKGRPEDIAVNLRVEHHSDSVGEHLVFFTVLEFNTLAASLQLQWLVFCSLYLELIHEWVDNLFGQVSIVNWEDYDAIDLATELLDIDICDVLHFKSEVGRQIEYYFGFLLLHQHLIRVKFDLVVVRLWKRLSFFFRISLFLWLKGCL